MLEKTKLLRKISLAVLCIFFIGMSGAAAASDKLPVNNPVAEMTMGMNGIIWHPKVEYSSLVLSVATPDGTVLSNTFEPGNTPCFELSGTTDQRFPDGSYTYEIRVIPSPGKTNSPQRPLTQTGYFLVREGIIVNIKIGDEPIARTQCCTCTELDGSYWVDGTLAVGHETDSGDCDEETLRLKEDDIRVRFYDTTTTTNYPTNDWQILINDLDSCGTSGGEYFSIQDVDGSKRPFTIEAGAPDNCIYVADDGKVGVGTSTPAYPFVLQTASDVCATLIAQSTGGAMAQLAGGPLYAHVGSKSNHQFRMHVNDSPVITLDTDGDVGIGTTTPSYPLHMSSGAYCSSGGTWTDASSREYKENITGLSIDEAVSALNDLNPVKYNFKVDKDETNVGFIAEDVPSLVATKNRKGMSPMDVVAVLTKVLQEQQKTISELKDKIADLEEKVK